MKRVCEFCEKEFTSYNYPRKYCPDYSKSGKRYAAQFKERKKNDPLIKIYTSHYGKRHNLLRQNKITKAFLDTWRDKAKTMMYSVPENKCTLDESQEWCEKTYEDLKKNVDTQIPLKN